jgi:hypothetical protein
LELLIGPLHLNDKSLTGPAWEGTTFVKSPGENPIMKLRTLFCSTLACSIALVAGQVDGSPASTNPASEIPHLRKQGTATQLIVDGKPFLALAGELGNNTAASLEYMKPVWPKLVDTKLNSVLAAVSRTQIEPEEGKFDFHVLDGVIREARNHNLRLVLL